jgi:uncharacterized membrane protein
MRTRLAPAALRTRGLDAAAVSRLYRALLAHSQVRLSVDTTAPPPPLRRLSRGACP